MNMIKLSVIFCIAAAMACLAAPAPAVSPNPAEMAEAQRWAKMFENLPQSKEEPFFSFTYDGKPSAELLAQWERKRTNRKIDDERTERTIVWTDSKTGLEVRCVSVVYADFPVVEWTVYFKNAGKADTPILENIQGLDVSLPREGEGDFVLHTMGGDACAPSSYQPLEFRMGKDASQRFAAAGGRLMEPHRRISTWNGPARA
jgi:alpha-galactosidase